MTSDEYDKRILSRRYGNNFSCNNCGKHWLANQEDILESRDLFVKLRCPYCHHTVSISRTYKWL